MSEVWEQYMNKPNNKDDREVLTDDCIREDLLDRVKLTGIRLALFSIPFALLVCVFCFFPELIFIYLLLCIAVLGYMVYFIRRFVIALSGYMHCRKHIRVVTDRKCGEKIVYAWWADWIVALTKKWCYLFFSKLEEAQAGIKIAGRNINNLRYADDTTFMAESEEELKSLLMKVKEESEKLA